MRTASSFSSLGSAIEEINGSPNNFIADREFVTINLAFTESVAPLSLSQQIVTSGSSDPSRNERPDRRGIG